MVLQSKHQVAIKGIPKPLLQKNIFTELPHQLTHILAISNVLSDHYGSLAGFLRANLC